jgi:hypothetical protein
MELPDEPKLANAFRSSNLLTEKFQRQQPKIDFRVNRVVVEYANTADLTLTAAMAALREFGRSGTTPYKGRTIEKNILSQAPAIEDTWAAISEVAHGSGAHRRSLDGLWVFVAMRMVKAAKNYGLRDMCRKLLTLREKGLIDDRDAYHYLGAVMGARFKARDQFVHVKPADVLQVQAVISKARSYHGHYHDALEAFRYAPEKVRLASATVAPMLLKQFDTLFDEILGISSSFRIKCETDARAFNEVWADFERR